jgi:hypothetical protein
MAISVRKDDQELLLALAYALNAQQSDFTQSLADGYFHRDQTQSTNGPLFALNSITLTNVTVSATNAVDLGTTVALANQLFGIMVLHMSDDQVHLKFDNVNVPTLDGYQVQLASDLPSVEVLLNALKVLFDAHLTQSGVHQNNDTSNSVSSTPNATSLGTAETLANALKVALNAHMASAPTGAPRVRLIAM